MLEEAEEGTSLHRAFSVVFCVSLLWCGCTDAQWAVDDDGCRTPDRGVGTCITIHNCPPILEIFQESPKPLSQRVVAFLRRYQCGVDDGVVKVCCPSGPIVNQLVGGLPDVKNHRNLNLLPLDKCGLDSDEDKIVGGNKTGVFEFPWMVLLSYRTEQGALDFKCGGTIINYRYILTAAHCITNLDKLRLVGVRIGEHNVETPRDCDTHRDAGTGREYKTCADPPQDIGIEETVHHPSYSNATFTNDIGLIRLNRRIDLDKLENVRAVCLPYDRRFMNYNYTGRFVTVTGWGATETGRASNELLKVSLAVMTNEDCNDLYKTAQKKITNKQMCAGGVGGKDSCGGDSGGPLMVKMQPSTYEVRTFQQGVVSYGPKFCGITGLPGVYTRVAYYMDWILDSLKP